MRRAGGRRKAVRRKKKWCDLYGCSRLTVRKALEELTREGYIHKIQGKGTFVRSVRRRSRISLSSQAVPRSSARRT
ncbi:MAG: GntR family transcriptional regulator [Oscillospiraceae bacterium]